MIFTSFIIATAVVFIVSLCAAMEDFARYSDAMGASALLAVLLELSIICTRPAEPGSIGNMIWLAPADLIALGVTAYMFITKRSWWMFVLSFTFLLDLTAHAAVWKGWYAAKDTVYVYKATLNVIGYVQLVCAGWMGGEYVAGKLSAWLAGHRPSHLHLRHGGHR